ncbi:MAG: hypothetical protein IT454_15145 [Planctomycetes bacterium]|nr:hypothetical protein [Planctomycetota bacterium]
MISAQSLTSRSAVVARLDVLEDHSQVLALHQFHREVHAARRVEAKLVHRHDAGVVELARDLRLFQEAAERFRIDGRSVAGRRFAAPEHHLHRQRAPQLLVPDLQDRAHPAARDLTQELVARPARALGAQALEQLALWPRVRLRLAAQRHVRIDAVAKALLQPLRQRRIARPRPQSAERVVRRQHLPQLRRVLWMRAAHRLDVGLLARIAPRQKLEKQLLGLRIERRARSRHGSPLANQPRATPRNGPRAGRTLVRPASRSLRTPDVLRARAAIQAATRSPRTSR